MSATNKIIRGAHDNRVLISIWLAIGGFVALQLLSTRDQSLTQPFIDAAQNDKIMSIEADVKEIKTDVKAILYHSKK